MVRSITKNGGVAVQPRSLATAGLERAKKQRPKERRRSGQQALPVVVVWALEASSCSHGHGESMLVSHVQQGLVEESKILKVGETERERKWKGEKVE